MARGEVCGSERLLAGRLLEWLHRTPGRELAAEESRCLDELLADLFGYYLVHVGWTREFAEPIARSRIHHHVALAAGFDGIGVGSSIIAESGAFPVAGDSVDAVFLPHTLDFTRDPHQVLREVERVLIAEGRVIIFGFNPWSMWGIWRMFRGRSGVVPWCGRFLSPGRVADWLTLLGFDVEIQRPLMFLPPLRGSSLMRRLAPLEPLGCRWLPMFSGAYAIRAVKRVSTLTPLEPSWKRKARVLPGQAVEPTARGGANV